MQYGYGPIATKQTLCLWSEVTFWNIKMEFLTFNPRSFSGLSVTSVTSVDRTGSKRPASYFLIAVQIVLTPMVP